jgi:hypothetical protein
MAPLAEFLQIYSTAVWVARGSKNVMANYFHVMLKDMACSWFMILPLDSVRSWSGLCRDCLTNFQGIAKRHGH